MESAETLRAWLRALAATDRGERRFGARQHHYRLAAPLGEERVRAIENELELRLPDDYRAYVTETADGGAGPYHGLLPLDHPVQRGCMRGTFAFTAPDDAVDCDDDGASADERGEASESGRGHEARVGERGEAKRARAVYAGVIGLGHVGCGQMALLVVRGEAAGEVWLDAREAEAGVGPIAPSFGAYLEDWVERTSRNELPRAIVPPGRCALPNALSAYLARHEDALGLARGTIGGEWLRAALAALGPHAIAVTASRGGPFFDRDQRLDPCPACEQLLENLRAQGLAADTVSHGVPPIPARTSDA